MLQNEVPLLSGVWRRYADLIFAKENITVYFMHRSCSLRHVLHSQNVIQFYHIQVLS